MERSMVRWADLWLNPWARTAARWQAAGARHGAPDNTDGLLQSHGHPGSGADRPTLPTHHHLPGIDQEEANDYSGGF